MNRKYKYMTEPEFKQLKYLLSEMHLSTSEISRVTGRSSFTLDNIKKAADFAGYKAIISEIVNARDNKTSKAAEPNQSWRTESNSHSELFIILTKINDNLAKLVEAWNTIPDKKA